ncbi:enterochelin esterase [Branchiibius sp. NY16-3462-2]|nr:enterochelin esterase [Branchiibius sp. NY16-3462-2]
MATEVPYAPIPHSQEGVTYAYGADSAPRVGVPTGTLEAFAHESDAFPGTTRRVWLHRSAGHDPSIESAVMFFNDGWWYLDPSAAVRGAVLLDNLAADGALPQMIGVFVDPGILETPEGPIKNRNAEYDAFDNRYAALLVDELLPRIAQTDAISPEPVNRGVCGGSSGGNAAFTAGWIRPDAIGKVIAFNASFAQMPGGNPYPGLISKQPAGRLRIFLHAAHRDLNWNAQRDNWFAEALETGAALARAGWDFRLVVGDGGHNPNHGGALLPDAMRWLWS